MIVAATYQRTKSPEIHICHPGQSEQGLWRAIGGVSTGMICSRLYLNRITQVYDLDPADCILLVKVDDYVVGFEV